MFSGRLKNALSLAITLGIVLASGLGPAFQHTHEIGETDGVAPTLLPVSTHWHLSWLGWEFTFDEESPVAPDALDGAAPNVTQITSASDFETPLSVAVNVLPNVTSTSQFGHSAIANSVGTEVAAISCERNALCDIARGERSGVQRI